MDHEEIQSRVKEIMAGFFSAEPADVGARIFTGSCRAMGQPQACRLDDGS